MRLTLSLILASACFAQTIDYVRQVTNKPTLDAAEYAWSRTNGTNADGSLGSAGTKTITFTRCPKGLAIGRYAYISGGLGIAEAVPITVTNCTVSGGTAGFITVTTQNTHTGSWQMASASDGIQEAIVAAEAGLIRLVRMSDTTHAVHATIFVGSSVTLEGGHYSTTTVRADLSVSPVVKVGATGSVLADRTWLRNMRITRASGSVPAGSIGVHWENFNYCGQENIRVDSSAIGEKFGGAVSLGFDSINSHVDHATETYAIFDNAIEVMWRGGYFGTNAGVTDAPPKAFIVSGISDTIKFLGVSVIPRGTGTQWLMSFENFTSTNGGISFENLNSENIGGGFTSDANSAVVNALEISNSRVAYSPSAPLFSFNAATKVDGLQIINSRIAATINLTNPTWSMITSNFLLGAGGTITGGDRSELTFTGNTVASANTFDGSWQSLSIGNNVWWNTTPIITATPAVGAGSLQIVGNTLNTGQPILNTLAATDFSGALKLQQVFKLNLDAATPANGTMYYCDNCAAGAGCSGGGGALAVRVAGAWKCF